MDPDKTRRPEVELVGNDGAQCTKQHCDTEYYVQGTQRPQTTTSTHTAAVPSVDTNERPTINFNDDFDKSFQF